MQPLLTVMLACFLATACTLNNATSLSTQIADDEKTTDIDTFETTQKAREIAKAQGLPVLLGGNDVQYPPELNPSTTGHGWVNLRMDVLPNGMAENIVAVSSSNKNLEQAAIQSVRTWRFEPSRLSHSDYYHRVFFKGSQADHYQPSTPSKTD